MKKSPLIFELKHFKLTLNHLFNDIQNKIDKVSSEIKENCESDYWHNLSDEEFSGQEIIHKLLEEAKEELTKKSRVINIVINKLNKK